MSTLTSSIGLVFTPARSWKNLASKQHSLASVLLGHTLPLAAIPAIFWYFGITAQGWTIGAGDAMRMTPASAAPLCLLFYLAMVCGVLFLGFLVHWMADTYNSESSMADSVALISCTATPFFLAGVLGAFPILWVDLVVGTLTACYCIYLLYLGTPGMLKVKPELGFLYASAVFAAALVGFVALMGATVVLWDFGAAPVYTY